MAVASRRRGPIRVDPAYPWRFIWEGAPENAPREACAPATGIAWGRRVTTVSRHPVPHKAGSPFRGSAGDWAGV